jgi:hypothetical protein
LEEALSSFTGAAPITGDGTLGSLSSGGLGGLGAGGFGDPVSGLTSDGGIDVNAYMQQQQAVASGVGGWKSSGASMSNGLLSGTELSSQSGSASGSSPTGVRRPSQTGASKSNGRNVRLPSNSSSDGEPQTSPVSTSSGTAESSSPITSIDSPESPEPSIEVECLVLGYTTSVNGEIRSLLLAAAPNRELLRFVAKVPVEDVDADVLDQMETHFRDIPQRRSLVRCPYGGNWVKPEVFCVATYEGWTGERRLKNPQVVRLVESPQP